MKIKLSGRFELINDELWSIKTVVANKGGFLLYLPVRWVKYYCQPDDKGQYLVGYRQTENKDEIIIKAYVGKNAEH